MIGFNEDEALLSPWGDPLSLRGATPLVRIIDLLFQHSHKIT